MTQANYTTSQPVPPLLDTVKKIVYEFEFQYPDNPLWLRADVSVAQAFDTITTGLLFNKAVSKIKLFSISEGERSVSFTYDIVAAKQGNSPWALLPT